MKKRVYIADDEENIRELIKSFLESAGYDAQVFESGDVLFDAFAISPPDLIVLDIMMPGTNGLMLCRKIREKSNVPIIMVSARDSELDRITGIAIGSDDYLVKPFSPVELVTRINAIFRRMAYDQESKVEVDQTLRYGVMTIDLKTRSITYGGATFEVTPTEYALMVYLFRHQDRAVSREELLENVWQFDSPVDTRATDDLVKRLRKKLQTTDVRITSVWGYGFKLECDSND